MNRTTKSTVSVARFLSVYLRLCERFCVFLGEEYHRWDCIGFAGRGFGSLGLDVSGLGRGAVWICMGLCMGCGNTCVMW